MQHFERRRDRFDLFDRMDSPAVNLCFTMDLPDFRPWCKAQGLPPFHVLLCAVLRSVLAIPNFRYRVFEGEVIEIDRLMPSFTVTNQHHDLNFALFDWSDDLREFVRRGVAARDQAGAMLELNNAYAGLSPRQVKDQVFITLARLHLDPASGRHAGCARHPVAGLGQVQGWTERPPGAAVLGAGPPRLRRRLPHPPVGAAHRRRAGRLHAISLRLTGSGCRRQAPRCVLPGRRA